MNTEQSVARVAVVGAGLVGSLNAIYFAERGWQVDLYEQRSDMRLPQNKKNQQGKSINLALSERGLSALRATGLELDAKVLEASIPMLARMIHINGTQQSQPYSVHGKYINAVGRGRLNEILLDSVEKMDNVKVYFEHRLSQVQFKDNEDVVLFFDGRDEEHRADLLVGADGAYSRTRSQIMREPKSRWDYQQQYIDTAYCELSMATHNGGFALDPNHLHIWPRRTFMLIALANPDKSFTCTLFMPLDMFEEVDNNDKLLKFFNENFQDAVPLIGEETLKKEYFSNPRGSLISLKVAPHHYGGKAVILGDAAHAMVPFYGQGMNCGFQDVEVLHNILDRYSVEPKKAGKGTIPHLAEALQAYSDERVKDAHAICDLAMYNHYEMRAAVTSRRYLMRKRVEGWLHLLFPRLVIPLYTMVSFSTLPYSQAVERWSRQTRWINITAGIIALAATGIGLRQYKAIYSLARRWG